MKSNIRGLILFLGILIAVIAILKVLDFGIQEAVLKSEIMGDPVDIPSDSALYSKIRYFKDIKSPRIAICGDSAVLGEEMSEYGDSDWREHSMDKLIEDDLKVSQPVEVVNFGMNGVEVADNKSVIDGVLEGNPQVIMIGLSIGDFTIRAMKKESPFYTRRWLQHFRITPDGWVDQAAADNVLGINTAGTQVERTANDFLNRFWFTYRARDFLQSYFLGAPPSEAVRKFARRLNNQIRGTQKQDAKLNLRQAIEVARNDYAHIDLSEDSFEVQSLRKLLSELNQRHQATVVFMLPENPATLDLVIGKNRYKELQSQLKKIIRGYRSENLVTVTDPIQVPADDYDDQVHFNKKGYRDYVKKNIAPLYKFIEARSRAPRIRPPAPVPADPAD